MSDLEFVARWARSLAGAVRDGRRSAAALRAELALLDAHLARVLRDDEER